MSANGYSHYQHQQPGPNTTYTSQTTFRREDSAYAASLSNGYPQHYSPTAPYSGRERSHPSKVSDEHNTYPCLYEACAIANTWFARKADLERHVYITHNRASIPLHDCQIPGCQRRGNQGFTRRDKMIDHMREVHKANLPKRPSGRKSDSPESSTGYQSSISHTPSPTDGVAANGQGLYPNYYRFDGRT